jgi:glycosyltransferase involved in cell wall biosynthesis
MRIAYLAPYKGTALTERRPGLRNLSLSNKVKIELVSQALRAGGHHLEIISQGEVDRYKHKYYPGFQEPTSFDPEIPIHYVSSLPIRYVNGFWCGWQTVRLFQTLHRRLPFDLVIIFNMKPGHVACASHAARRLGLPVILEYEDDSFVDIVGRSAGDFRARRQRNACQRTLQIVSGGIAVSPHLLSQFRPEIPKLLLRGAVGKDIGGGNDQPREEKKNWIVYSGTHIETNGVAQLIEGYRRMNKAGWELHITGHGEKTEELKKLAAPISGVVFHGLVSRKELVALLRSARICVNPQVLSTIPGNVFPFKIIEYLAAGAHVVSTPLGSMENEIERAITYMPDNDPATIAATLERVIQNGDWKKTSAQQVWAVYGPDAVSQSLHAFLEQVQARAT